MLITLATHPAMQVYVGMFVCGQNSDSFLFCKANEKMNASFPPKDCPLLQVSFHLYFPFFTFSTAFSYHIIYVSFFLSLILYAIYYS